MLENLFSIYCKYVLFIIYTSPVYRTFVRHEIQTIPLNKMQRVFDVHRFECLTIL